MKIILRGRQTIEKTLIQVEPQIIAPAEDPTVITPLSLDVYHYQPDRGLQDMANFFRGDTVNLDITLLDFRENPFPDLDTATSIEIAFRQLTPVRKQLFVLTADSVVDPLLGLVRFILTPTQTNQAAVEEAVANVRVEVAPGEYVTFETFSATFRDSAFVT